jgi:hypothetical protein
VLVDAWAPLFAISMGIPRSQMLDMSVPVMVDHVEHWAAVTGRGDDG